MDAEQTQVNLLVVRAFDALRIPFFQGATLDRAYLREGARDLGVAVLLCRAVGEAGLPPAAGGA